MVLFSLITHVVKYSLFNYNSLNDSVIVRFLFIDAIKL